MTRRTIMATTVTGLAAATALGAYMSRPSQIQREDCPGKIICPITGELICADECPAEAVTTIELPVANASGVPACCAGKD